MATHDVGGNVAFVEMNMQDVSNDATTIATGVSTKERASIGRERHKLMTIHFYLETTICIAVFEISSDLSAGGREGL